MTGPSSSAAPLVPTGTGDQAAVPGGVVGLDIGGLIGSEAITPLVLFGALAAAFLLGAGHALTPGHGKTLMGAYLVGSRGTALHAIALGLAVTVSHTLGIVVLAAIILQARSVAPELFNTVAPIASGATVVAIGAWLLFGQLRAYRARRQDRTGQPPRTKPRRRLSPTATTTTHSAATLPISRPRTWPTPRSAGAACSSWAWPAA